MKTAKIFTMVLFLAAIMVLAGCSRSVAIHPGTSIVSPDSGTHMALSQPQTEQPWWVNGGIDSNWPY